MKDTILTKKLRRFAEHGNIEMDRCIEIAQAANDALIEQSKGGELPQLAAAMFRCCGTDADEAAYFRCAVDSLLQEKWGAKPRDSAVLTASMDMSYRGIWSALQAGREDEDGEVSNDKPNSLEDQPIFRSTRPAGPLKTPKDVWMAQIAAESRKAKSSGCLVILGFIGILPLGIFAVRHFLA